MLLLGLKQYSLLVLVLLSTSLHWTCEIPGTLISICHIFIGHSEYWFKLLNVTLQGFCKFKIKPQCHIQFTPPLNTFFIFKWPLIWHILVIIYFTIPRAARKQKHISCKHQSFFTLSVYTRQIPIAFLFVSCLAAF